METQPETEPALRGLAERYAAGLEAEICAQRTGQGGVLAARAVGQAALDGLRRLEMEGGERRQRVESLLAQAESNIPTTPASPPALPKTWFALGGSRKPSAGVISQNARLRIDLAVLQGAATLLRRLKDRMVASIEPLRHLQAEIRVLVEAFASTSDDEIAAFLDLSHPELVAQFDEEWRTGTLGGAGESLTTSLRKDSSRANLLERLRQSGRAKVLDTLRRDDFRELLPGGLGDSRLKPGLLKPYLERAAPHLDACGGSRRLWLIGACDALSASLRAAIELETAQVPSVVIDPHSDFVVGWETEGMSLPHVAARLIDNQRETAELASRLHTRLDIAW